MDGAKSERKYFGTDGMRGVANVAPLDPQTLVRLGKGIALILQRRPGKHKVLIGKDTRLSGYMIETAIAAGITAMGVDVLLVGPLPTPGVAYLTRSMRVDAGIMISASHNPFEDNGIKLFNTDGYKLPDSLERELEQLIDGDTIDRRCAESSEIGKAYRLDDAVGRYTVYLKESFPRELTLEGMGIGMDCGNGASYIVGPQTLRELGAEVVVRGVSPNGRNINAGVGSLYPEVVRRLVLEQKLDLGIAFDGDADRVILVDERGVVHDGDCVLAICAHDFHQRGILRNPVAVGTVMSNLGLAKFMNDQGIRLERSAVGDRYLLETMVQHGAQIGGEQSGHTIFLDHSTTGDGILTALMVLAVLGRKRVPFSQLASAFVRFPQKLINIPVTRKPPLTSIPEIQSVIAHHEKELGESGRVLVRYSGTENKARVMVEAADEAACAWHAQEIAGVIQRELGS